MTTLGNRHSRPGFACWKSNDNDMKTEDVNKILKRLEEAENESFDLKNEVEDLKVEIERLKSKPSLESLIKRVDGLRVIENTYADKGYNIAIEQILEILRQSQRISTTGQMLKSMCCVDESCGQESPPVEECEWKMTQFGGIPSCKVAKDVRVIYEDYYTCPFCGKKIKRV